MIVEHPSRPSLPAETAMKVPAARTLSTAVCRLPTEHPSSGGQRYELPIAFGRFDGSGFAPFRSVGARKNWRHSMYVLGRPTPSSMFRQAIHLAPGATPIWFPAPSSPTAVPIVCVPWEMPPTLLSSHGALRSKPHGFVPSPLMSPCTASHQV